MQMPVLVIKFGSAVITKDEKVNENIIERLANEIDFLSGTYRIVIVSSGAVASGKAFLKNYKSTLIHRKAAAAIGNPLLIQLYQKYFAAKGFSVAQALCERHHFSNRSQFLQLKETFLAFWENGIIPVVNENDLVSNIELKFSDNDELATLLAISLNAHALILFTSAGGLLDEGQNIISIVEKIDENILGLVKQTKTQAGVGGMLSKLTFTKLATALGIKVIISGFTGKDAIYRALQGACGTTFPPQISDLKARQKWLASGSVTMGGITIDSGAEKAIFDRKSLLAVGIVKVTGSFSSGEVVQLVNESQTIIGVAKVRLSSEELTAKLAQKNVIAVHANDVVTL